jgi:hypothetical protein
VLDVVLPVTVYFHPKYAAPLEENLSFLAPSGTEDAVTAHKENSTASQQFKR